MRCLYPVVLLLFINTINMFAAQKECYPVSQIPDSLRMDAYSVVRFESTHFEYYDQQNGLEKVIRVVTVLDEKGKEAANFIEYGDKFRQVKSFSGEVYDQTGKLIRKVKQSDLQTTSISENFASDDVTSYYECTQPVYPFTVKYEYEVKYPNGMIQFPLFCPFGTPNQAVEKAEYSLQIPNSVKFQMYATNMPDKAEKSSIKDNDVYTWNLNGIKAIDEEPYMPRFTSVIPMLQLKPESFYYDKTAGQSDTWADLGKWSWGLIADRDNLLPKTIDKVKEVIAGASSDKEKIKRLYNYLQSSTRYVSIQLGIGGYQPIPASTVGQTGFGDCKGLSNYMRAMLKVAGVNSYYTIIKMGGEKDFIAGFSSPGQANHVILTAIVQQDTIPLECTSTYEPCGYVHRDIAGHDALLVTPEGGKLYRLPSYPDTANVTCTTLHIKVDNGGLMQAKVRSVYKLGDYEDMIGFAKVKSNSEQVKEIKSDFRLPNMDIADIAINEKHDELPAITVNYTLSSDTYVNKSGTRMFFPVNPHKDGFKFSSRRSRKYPFVFSSGSVECDTVYITVPDGFKIESKPVAVSLKKEFGNFASAITQDGNTLRVVQRLYVPAGKYPATMNDAMKAFFTTVNNAYSAQIVLKTP